MGYKILMQAGPMPHPPFPYDTFEAAKKDAQQAVSLGYFRRTENDAMKAGNDNILIFQLGVGSVLRAVSDEVLDAMMREKQDDAQRVQGLVVAQRSEPKAYKLIIQGPGGQLEPMDFDTAEEAEHVVQTGIKEGVLFHARKEGEDEQWIQTGPGTLFMVLSREHHDMQRRRQIESAVQQRAQQAAPVPKLIIPGN